MIVPWEHCTACGEVDGVHSSSCTAASACITVGCGRTIEADSEMREDGLCNSCTEVFILESLAAEAQDLSCSRCLHAGETSGDGLLPSCALMDVSDVEPGYWDELQQAAGTWRHERRRGAASPTTSCPGIAASRPPEKNRAQR